MLKLQVFLMKTLTVNPNSKRNELRKIGVPNSLVETIENIREKVYLFINKEFQKIYFPQNVITNLPDYI